MSLLPDRGLIINFHISPHMKAQNSSQVGKAVLTENNDEAERTINAR